MVITSIDDNDKRKSYRQIYDSIAEDIQNGLLKPGDSLPSLRELGSRLAVSHTTVRRAYDKLLDDGYIDSVKGDGFIVSPLQGQERYPDAGWRAFLSYVQRDDQLTHGGITNLKEAIAEEYELVKGAQLDIFMDKEKMATGDDFRQVIEDNLESTVLFIPILTPGYLRSPICLHELKSAIDICEARGLESNIYPIEYVDITAALDDLADNGLATYLSNHLRDRHFKDVRNESPDSSRYRDAISSIVKVIIGKEHDLIEAQRNFEENLNNKVDEAESADYPAGDGDDGLFDQIARIEQEVTTVEHELNEGSTIISQIDEVTRRNMPDPNMSTKRKMARVLGLASDLEPLANELKSHCKNYRNHVSELDKSIDAYLELMRLDGTPDLKLAQEFYANMRKLVNQTETPFQQMTSFKNSALKLGRLSHSLWKPSTTIAAAIDDILSSQPLFKSWENKAHQLLDVAIQTSDSETTQGFE